MPTRSSPQALTPKALATVPTCMWTEGRVPSNRLLDWWHLLPALLQLRNLLLPSFLASLPLFAPLSTVSLSRCLVSLRWNSILESRRGTHYSGASFLLLVSSLSFLELEVNNVGVRLLFLRQEPLWGLPVPNWLCGHDPCQLHGTAWCLLGWLFMPGCLVGLIPDHRTGFPLEAPPSLTQPPTTEPQVCLW